MSLGIPASVSSDAGTECDTYNLYTHGVGEFGKGSIAALELAADAFTLGLAEAWLTPIELTTKSKPHPVKFCYKDDKLVDVTEIEAPAEEPQRE